MIVKNKKPSPPKAPAKWERWLAVATSFLALLLVLPTLIMIAIGLLEFAFAWKRHPLFARHGLHVALWQVPAFLLLGILFFVSGALSSLNLWLSIFALKIGQVWSEGVTGERVVLVLLGLLLVGNIAVMAWSIVQVLRGRAFVAPLIGRLVEKGEG